ncbi:MAG TPA: photosynthetic reaction center cytochrome PufC [Sandaracinaceae bacterium LLY-WYZ-13_1]|nr:photosynthetic reaction center cytochrome PufC [Sandaracinaceae bacterium LLY-WYZ-13_1]
MKIYRPLLAVAAALLLALAVYWYEPTDTSAIGYPGVAMQVTESEERLAERVAANEVPAPLPPPSDSGRLASEEYENVQVLGHLTTAQFTRLMTAITLWVAPDEGENAGCAYCHNTQNMASDERYPKIVSRRMIQMTQHINESWQQHVGQTGVTCWTCHRGNAVPEYIWYEVPEDDERMLGARAHQNAPIDRAGLSSLPENAFEEFLLEDTGIRVQSTRPLPSGNRHSIKQTEWTYSLMMHFSRSLGVNCTYCHNSRSWADWSQSPAQRATAWYGIRMVRRVNHGYLESLEGVFPDYRLGPTGDVPKANCMTCHQGAYRPLLGVSMLSDYPSLAASAPVDPTGDAVEASDTTGTTEEGEPAVDPDAEGAEPAPAGQGAEAAADEPEAEPVAPAEPAPEEAPEAAAPAAAGGGGARRPAPRPAPAAEEPEAAAAAPEEAPGEAAADDQE